MPARRVLFIGDVVGDPGREALAASLPSLIERHSPDLVVANGENSAGGVGINERSAQRMLDAGVDLITTGNHVFRHRNAYELLDTSDRIVRPANYLPSNPGRGQLVHEKGGVRWAIVNLSGNAFLDAACSAFTAVERALAAVADADFVIVDFHAEATSEKVAMGWHLDGRVLAVIGTHTHVPTADARVLPGGTAYLTDAGMTGARGGVIGVKREQALERFVTQLPIRFETSDEDLWIMGCLIETQEQRLARSIELVMEPARR